MLSVFYRSRKNRFVLTDGHYYKIGVPHLPMKADCVSAKLTLNIIWNMYLNEHPFPLRSPVFKLMSSLVNECIKI